jgi:hypothetical protein
MRNYYGWNKAHDITPFAAAASAAGTMGGNSNQIEAITDA